MGYFTMKNRKVTSFDEYVCSSPNTVLHQLKSIRKYLLISIQCSSGGNGSQDTMPRLNRARHPALLEGDASPFSHPWRLGLPTPATAPCPACLCLKLQVSLQITSLLLLRRQYFELFRILF